MRRDEVDLLVEALRVEFPDSAGPVTELSKRVALLGGRLQAAVQAEIAEFELTYADFEVLAALRRGGRPYRRKPNELARTLFLTTGGISNVLNRLQNAGLVVREVDPEDARSRWVVLTAEGVRKAENAIRAAGEVQAEILADVPEKTLRRAADALREVIVELNDSRGPRRPPSAARG